jgi:hypothetical protein
MNAYVLVNILPSEICIHVNYHIVLNAIDVIRKNYFRRCLIKTKLVEYFLYIRPYYSKIDYYPVHLLPTFYDILSIMDRYITGIEDYEFWFKVYISLNKTLGQLESTYENFYYQEKISNVIKNMIIKFDGMPSCYFSTHLYNNY